MTLKSQLFIIIYVILALLISRDWCKYQSIHLTSATTCTCCRPILNKLDAFSYLGSTLCSRFLVNLSNTLFEYLLKESHLKWQKKYKYYFLGFNRPRPGGETLAKLQNTPQLWSASLTCVGRLWRSRHNTIDAILIQWHVNELRGILKLLQVVHLSGYNSSKN